MKARKAKITRKRSEARAFSPKHQQRVIDRARGLAEALCAGEGLELVHLEFQREPGGWTMRLYIDKAGGINLDDCANISRQMNDLLDVHLEDMGPYNLEVTSPGPNRPLAKRHDFERFKGNVARIKTVEALRGQKNFKGVLMGICGEHLKLSIGKETIDIALTNIARARLVNFSGEN